jgi:hypothetical protein
MGPRKCPVSRWLKVVIFSFTVCVRRPEKQFCRSPVSGLTHRLELRKAPDLFLGLQGSIVQNASETCRCTSPGEGHTDHWPAYSGSILGSGIWPSPRCRVRGNVSVVSDRIYSGALEVPAFAVCIFDLVLRNNLRAVAIGVLPFAFRLRGIVFRSGFHLLPRQRLAPTRSDS